MRPKIVISLLLAGLVVLSVIFFLKPSPHQPPAAEVALVEPATSTPETKPAVPQVSTVTNNPAARTTARLVNSTPFTTGKVVGDGAEQLEAQINRLQELQANDDDASLQAILKELTNTNRIIRHVAIEATIQFGGHTAVPILQGLAARTWDAAEKKELLDAAEFLALPTLSEVRAEDPNAKIIPPQDESPLPGTP